jgi:pimeloyl-ACP methyl ester carboxylesterase
MFGTMTLFCSLMLAGTPTIESLCQQVAPVPADAKWARSADKMQAVVLIHGFYLHFKDKNVPRAALRPWQNADSALVKALAKSADVFVFAYGQNASVDTITNDSKLADNIAELRKLGYKDIVLVGHSAGGLIARQFVEDHPDAGVTKVVQVCAPNGGSPLAGFQGPKSQQAFMACLTEKGRQQCMKDRSAKQIPAKIQFVCVVARGDGNVGTDGVVPCVNQWTADLQKQGIPAIGILGDHRQIVRDARIAQALADVIGERHTRWTTERIEQAKKEIFGTE